MCHPTARGVACVLSTKAKGFKFLDVVVVEVWNPNRPGGLISVVCRGTVAWAMGFTLYTYTGNRVFVNLLLYRTHVPRYLSKYHAFPM